MSREPLDDLDLLYARLEPVDLPPNFVASVMARLQHQNAPAHRWRRAGLLALDLVAALVLIWAAFSVGRVLALGAFDHGAAGLLFDLDLALAAPAAWLIAVGELLPLVAVVCLVAAATVVAVSTHALLVGAVRRARIA
ncbi:MAG: hypothetical protein KatS3mg060_0632 [Dehalococcoidia bacterium]|nr:MAG: hypothetical protein KatS3mg060_0632 [Dehalococcoidia bacterium]